jgi:hypothetical protein
LDSLLKIFFCAFSPFFHLFGLQSGTDDSGLKRADQERIARCLLKITENAQFSKNNNLSESASDVAARLSYFYPTMALPSVIERLKLALETVGVV